jgi:hypothetical protein
MNRAFLTTSFLALCCALPGFGQGFGSIAGVVSDPSGAPISAAQVVVANTATGVRTQTVSNETGGYTAAPLPPGNYQLSVEFPGFKKYVSSGIVVHVSDRLRLDVNLQIGEAKESVVVTGEASPLRTEDAQLGEVINNNFIRTMPQLNRNPFDLLRLSGNVQGAEATGAQANQTSAVRINGGRTSSVEYFVDGAVATTGRAHVLTNQTPSMDAVQEFKVVTNGISAEYGRISGGYIELVTKSGTNSYHGSAYEYMFNNMFNANSWEQNALGNRKVHFRQNNFCFTLGGPVKVPKVYNGANKTFFFVDNEYFRRTQAGALVVMSVPNAAERNGDMTNTRYLNIPTLMYDPYGPQVPVTDANGNPTGRWRRTGLLGGDGKRVPASLISPVARAILSKVPMPNRASVATSSSQNNYAEPQTARQDNFRLGVRLDQNFSSNHRLAIFYTTFSADQRTSAVGGPLRTSAATYTDGGRSGKLNYDWMYRPTLLFNFRAAVIHNPLVSGASHAQGNDNSFLPAIYHRILRPGDTPIIRTAFMGSTDYAQSDLHNVTVSTTYDLYANATKILNRHTIKFGWQGRRYYDNFINYGSLNIMNFMINPVADLSGDHGNAIPAGGANSMGSFLLGINNRNIISAPATRAMNVNYNALYIQDDFKLSPKLTLNFGLRWDAEGPTTERHNKLYFWDPDTPSLFRINPNFNWQREAAAAGLPANTPVPAWVRNNAFPNGAILIAGTREFPSRTPQRVDYTQFAPRLGLAYQLSPKTVIRAYGGMMYLPTTGNAGGYSSSNPNLPLSDGANAGWHASEDGGRTFISTWANPFPLPGMVTQYSRDTLFTNQQSSQDPGAAPFTRDMRMPREYNWSANVQRELPGNLVLELSYTGNRGLGLLAPLLISRYPAELLKPEFGNIMVRNMTSPTAGQTQTNTVTGPMQQVGILQYPMPYYGNVNLLGSNIGSSTFHAMHVRVDKRFSSGVSFLLNYSYSRLFDNVGGPEADTVNSVNAVGQGGKRPQTVLDPQSVWGRSGLDQTHRLTMAYTVELPFGSGRHWLNTNNTLSRKLLDKVVGGWRISGLNTYVSGLPVSLISSSANNVNNVIKVNQTYAQYTTADKNISNPNYTGDQQVLVSPATPISAALPRRFDSTKLRPAQYFQLGTVEPVDPFLRNPSFYQLDLSLMKDFRLGPETRYLQFRAEAQNALNIRGFGPYNAIIGGPAFGLIQSAGNQPRQIQLSLRFMF